MNNINNLFFELIQVALGVRICLSQTPNDMEWKALYNMAKKQSLVGVCFAGVQRLQTQQQEPPEMLYLTWMGMAAKIQQRNEIVNRQCVEVQKMIEKEGFRTFIMKGQGTQPFTGLRTILQLRSGTKTKTCACCAKVVTLTSIWRAVLSRCMRLCSVLVRPRRLMSWRFIIIVCPILRLRFTTVLSLCAIRSRTENFSDSLQMKV